MSANATWFEASDGKFHHDNPSWGIGPAELGVEIAASLMSGSEVSAWGLTVNYLTEMLRYTGRVGRFYDVLDTTVDHEYDPNTPTPGVHWGKARQLQRLAQQLTSLGTALPSGGGGVLSEIQQDWEYDAEDLREAAQYLLTDGRPHAFKPLDRNYTVPVVRCADPRIGSNAIWYQPKSGLFHFGGHVASPKKLGRIIALSLMKGEEKVTIAGLDLTVNYLIEMLRWTGKNGQFRDFTDDDLFDANVPPRSRNRRPVYREQRW